MGFTLKKVCTRCGAKWSYDFTTCVFCGGESVDLPASAPARAPEAPAAPPRRRPWWKFW